MYLSLSLSMTYFRPPPGCPRSWRGHYYYHLWYCYFHYHYDYYDFLLKVLLVLVLLSCFSHFFQHYSYFRALLDGRVSKIVGGGVRLLGLSGAVRPCPEEEESSVIISYMICYSIVSLIM